MDDGFGKVRGRRDRLRFGQSSDTTAAMSDGVSTEAEENVNFREVMCENPSQINPDLIRRLVVASRQRDRK